MTQLHGKVSSVPAPDLKRSIGLYVKAGIGITIYFSRFRTMDVISDLTRQEVIALYRAISNDHRLSINHTLARQVVAGDIQIAWFQAMGRDVPPLVTSRQEDRMAKAKAATEKTEVEETTEKKPRVTIRGIIETGLLAGTSTDDILAEVKSQFPDSKADASHVGYYRHFLIKNGQMEKPEKPPKIEKPKGKSAQAAIKEVQEESAKAPAKGPAARRAMAQQASASAKEKEGVGRTQPKPGREKASSK